MVGNLHVRNLDDDLIARLKRRAARHGRSTEAEHREILRQALSGDVEPSFDTEDGVSLSQPLLPGESAEQCGGEIIVLWLPRQH